MTCKEAEAYILAIPKFAGKRPLKDTARLLGRITGEPEAGRERGTDGTCRIQNSKVIHIAGTNGKGSVCAYLRSILLESGCSVGMFTSPHLEEMRERICLGQEMISQEEFVFYFEKIRAYTEEEMKSSRPHPSFFEFLFLMAMAYFEDKKPEYIILETGLGGRLDATSCVEPDVCVITEIGYDHMQYLGDTIEQITSEKAAIIRPGVPVVFVDRRRESTEILTGCAGNSESPATIIGKDNILNVNINHKSIDFSLHTGYYKYVSFSLNTIAVYQTENASLAVAATEYLRDKRVTESTVRKGLWKAFWPGRMEVLMPGVYLDGAHNEDGIEAFLTTVERDGCGGRRFLLFGVSEDKQYSVMIQKVAKSGLFERAAVTVFETDRSASLNTLKAAWAQYKGISCSFYEDAEKACLALLKAKGGGDRIYIAGSLYLAGQIKSLIRRI